jgi:CRISPR/Cas system-associated exonuclease Cas4 (RecB family)
MITIMAPAVRAPNVSERPPNRLAEQITGRTYLSHSQISTMRSCPRKFAFLYVEKAPADFIPSSLIFGGSIHSSLELHFRARLEGLHTTHAALISAYRDSWRRQKEQGGDNIPVRFNKDLDENQIHALAERMIAAFMSSPLASPKGTVLGIEEELRVQLDPELPDLLAKVDLVTQTDGCLHVVDFKTSRSRWNEQKAEESGEQLLLYGVTVAEMSPHLGRAVKLHFAIITKAEKPVVQLIPVPSSPDRVESLKESVAAVWSAIQTGNFYPSPSPQNCTTCPYRSRCPVFGNK